MKSHIFPLCVVIAMVLCSCSSLDKKSSKSDFGKPVSAGQDDKFALYNLGHAYLEGNGVPKDEKRGFDLLYRSARLGFSLAQLEVGDKLRDTDPAEAFQFYAEAAKQNNIPAHNRLGDCYLNGTGTAKDVPKALEHYKRAADAGDIDSIKQLGIIYYLGEECEKDLQKAFSYFRTLDEKGHSWGGYFLGMMYLKGNGVTQSTDTALFYFRRSAQLGDPDAQVMVGDLLGDTNPSEAFQFYAEAAKQNNVPAHNRLGDCYLNGTGTAKNVPKALEHYKRAADAGDIDSIEQLGLIYYLGEVCEKDLQKAFSYFRTLDEKGNSLGSYMVGKMYLNGEGVAKSADKALFYFRKSAQLGDPDASVMVGDLLRDTASAEAFQFYAEAAKQNNIPAHNRLGYCYLNGTGTAKDVSKALEHYKQAADAGDMDSIWQLGLIYFHEADEKDLQKAFSYFRTLDEKGDSRGSFWVGLMYWGGEGGVEQSDYTAFLYIRKSAEKKGPCVREAQECLGLMYYRGRGTSQDFDQAAYWLELAADAGAEEAQKLLGYRNGAKPDTSRISFAKRLAMKYTYELENHRRNRSRRDGSR